jgi:hypothetical protein
MVMVVVVMLAGGTNSVFGLKLIIRYSVQDACIQKLPQATINRGPVNFAGKGFFKLDGRKGGSFPEKGFQDFQALAGLAKPEILKDDRSLVFH